MFHVCYTSIVHYIFSHLLPLHRYEYCDCTLIEKSILLFLLLHFEQFKHGYRTGVGGPNGSIDGA